MILRNFITTLETGRMRTCEKKKRSEECKLLLIIQRRKKELFILGLLVFSLDFLHC